MSWLYFLSIFQDKIGILFTYLGFSKTFFSSFLNIF